MQTKRQTENQTFLQTLFHHHRQELDDAVMMTFDAHDIDWKTVNATGGDYELLAQWKGLSYMKDGSHIRAEWNRRWPKALAQPTWDGLARIQTGNSWCWEWMSVWSASRTQDLSGSCPATGSAGEGVAELVREAKRTAKVLPVMDWLGRYFPYTSRLALRSYLQRSRSCARMLTILFYSDDGVPEVPTMREWENYLIDMNRYLGLSGHSAVEKRSPLLYFPADLVGAVHTNQ